MNNGFISNGLQVAYERVNLADIETSSDEDDYGDLFAHVSRNIFDHARNVKSQNIFIINGPLIQQCILADNKEASEWLKAN